MTIKKKLGRGLSDLGLGLGELLSSVNKAAPQQTHHEAGAAALAEQSQQPTMAAATVAAGAIPTGTHHSHGLRHIGVELLHPGKYQPRQDFAPASLEELAASIKEQGIIQPILVRTPHQEGEKKGEYEIIAGERRWRAAQLAGLSSVPIIVRDVSDEQAAAVALIENLQREDLNSIDTAQGLQRLISEFGMTHQAIATVIGKSRATITNLLRLLALPDAVKSMVQRGELEMGHARAILALPPQQQLATANIVVTRKMSVRATEELVQKLQKQLEDGTLKKALPRDNIDPDIAELQHKLRDALGAKVTIKCATKGKNRGKGKLIIHYNSLDELDGILKTITG